MSILDLFIGSAHAQSAAPEDAAADAVPMMSILASWDVVYLTGAAITFAVLAKIFARWPKAEPLLVGASLLAIAAFCVYQRVLLLPLLVVTAVLGGLWVFVKTRTGLLSGPDGPTASARAAAPAAPSATAKYERPAPPAAEAALSDPTRPSRPAQTSASALDPVAERIFISYRRQDSADVTGRIYDRLVQRFGKDQIFKDVDSIPLGVDFREHLGSVVGRCNLLLAVIGDQWTGAGPTGATRRIDDAKDFVRLELEAALERGIPVIPVLVRGAALPEESSLPSTLARLSYRHGISVRVDPDFHRDVDRLVAGIEAHLKL
ncbi:MAG: toll/interleukin-1 receptor domain-containing protein [Caldimonas sp.]